MPQPDLALLKPRADTYKRSLPTPADALLVIEVSDTTLAFDLGTRVALYARHGIREAWVVDLSGQAVHVCREPGGEGYGEILIVKGDDVVSSLALPEVRLVARDLFQP